jgi:hypothetical protein
VGAGFSAAHHVLVKGGLFLAIGASAAGGPRLWPVLIPSVVLALSLGGLPFTGGMLAKLAVKAQHGAGLVGTLATLAAVGSTLLMLHFLRSLMQTSPLGAVTATPAGLVLSWLITAFAAVAVPWVLYPTTVSGSLLAALAPGTLWAALWPVLIGGVLAIGLRRWRSRLPRVPAGDVVVVGERSIRAIITWGEGIERADQYLRQWSVACLLLLTFLVILGTAMLAWG